MPIADQAFIAAFNHILQQAAWARKKLVEFAGKNVRLEIQPLVFTFSISDDGLTEQRPDSASSYDVNVIIPPADLPALLTAPSQRKLAHIRLDGDAQLADALGAVFQHLNWDAEEDLSRLTGDILARRILRGADKLLNKQRELFASAETQAVHYLTEMQPVLVTHASQTILMQEIQQLRQSLDALEHRLSRLRSVRN